MCCLWYVLVTLALHKSVKHTVQTPQFGQFSCCECMRANLCVRASRAPEQADAEHGLRGTHTDVWGFATCVLHLATGQLPYKGLTRNQTFMALLKSCAPEVPSSLPAWLQQALKQCLSFDAAAHPTVAHLRQVGAKTSPHRPDFSVCR